MTKPLNVLHITFDMRIGGTEQVIRNLIESANNDAFTMSILCLESPLGPFGEALQDKGVSITCLSRRAGIDKELIKATRAIIRERKIDIVHCHQYTPWFYGTLATAFTNTKTIFTEHGRFYPDSTTWKRRVINPLLLTNTDAVTAISQATKQALTEFEFIAENKIAVIYNGIVGLQPQNTARKIRQQLGLSDKTLLLGTVARLDPIKNHNMMLNAFKKVLDTGIDAKLVIVGDGEERANLESTIESLALTDNVILTGYITEPAAYLEAMDIYLLSSLSEGTSMTLLEAMSLYRPCVVTDAGGNPEIIEHGYNGLVTPNDDAQAYASAIIELCNNADARSEMGKAARIRFEERFSTASMTKSFEALYTALAQH
ncbi:glycosyltransferase [Alteromonas sp. H39]|uniref:glycosyltransferase n=1 Tax=Alteromonas sp. H39 TaxID=3389876 RepID=UPI0039E0580F